VGCGGGGEPERDALALATLFGELLEADVVLGAVGSGARLGRAMANLKRLAPGLTVDRRAVETGSPGAGLIDLAESEKVDMTVIGSTHRGPLGSVCVGTTADHLIAHATRPFAIAPRGYADRDDPQLRIIGLAYDGSDQAQRAADVATDLCVRGCVPLRAFGVREPLVAGMIPGPERPAREGMRALGPLENELDELLDALPASVGGQKLILAGDPATTLLAQGSRAADLMVLGTHGFGRFSRLLSGSVAGEIAHRAPWPVVIVPPERTSRRGARVVDDGQQDQPQPVSREQPTTRGD
jgi:nucleotide-binding universal stress UspA family protein